MVQQGICRNLGITLSPICNFTDKPTGDRWEKAERLTQGWMSNWCNCFDYIKESACIQKSVDLAELLAYSRHEHQLHVQFTVWMWHSCWLGLHSSLRSRLSLTTRRSHDVPSTPPLWLRSIHALKRPQPPLPKSSSWTTGRVWGINQWN